MLFLFVYLKTCWCKIFETFHVGTFYALIYDTFENIMIQTSVCT